MIARFCRWLCARYPHRLRVIYREGEPYLSRFYITSPRNDVDSDVERPERFGIYLHYFHQGDKDQDLHNHPWKWALSLILSGAYYEEILQGEEIVSAVRRAGRFNFLTDRTFHRVDILDEVNQGRDIWTLFITGPRIKRWGFKIRDTHEYIDWATYLRDRGEFK